MEEGRADGNHSRDMKAPSCECALSSVCLPLDHRHRDIAQLCS